MGGASSFYAMLAVTAFLFALWLSGRFARLIGMSSIVIEIGVGIVLGPSVLQLIPGELSECSDARLTECSSRRDMLRIAEEGPKYCDLQAYLDKGIYAGQGKPWKEGFFGMTRFGQVKLHGTWYSLNGKLRRRLASGNEGKTDYDDYATCLKEQCGFELSMKCATNPDIFSTIGHTGVAMMIFESGMHFDFEQARTVGPWACLVAVLGTFLPIITGAALSLAYGYDLFPDGLAVGVSLAPTSVGIALKLLHEAQALNLYFGQAVMTAAFVDDVLSLILFSVMFSIGGDMNFLTFLPLILGCIFMVVAIVLAVTLWPRFIKWMLGRIPETKPDANVTRHHEVMWLLMFVVLLAYAQITHLCGTHLWGCFIAGMSFATQHEAHHVWVRQVKRITCWFIRIFFAATLAWAIPVKQLFSFDAFWKGSIMGIGPCIMMKVFCAPFMGDSRWVIGWAMVGRAEFAYFIAIMAKSLKMMDDSLFAILIWSLVYATIFAPLLFRIVLKRYMKKVNADEPGKEIESGAHEAHGQAITRAQTLGHLPDLYAEKKEKEESEKLAKFEENEKELQKVKQEIDQLKARLGKAVAGTQAEEGSAN